jgi:23S rRNA (uracil747-C5)-methyltransferase
VAELGIEPYDVPGRRGELKYLLVTHSPDGEHMVRFVLRSGRHVADLRAALPRLVDLMPSVRVVTVNLHPEHKAVLEGDTEVPLTEQTLLPMRVGDATLLLGPRSFFQTNTVVAAQLYRQARTWADQAAPSMVWDLYCGVGGFALHLTAPGRTVVGVEASGEAVEAARAAALLHADAAEPASAGVVTFEVGDATTSTLAVAPDVVVVNPPRRGIGSGLAAWLDASSAAQVLYSSCNVDSLARDLAAMPSLRATAGRVFDMFPQTGHTEVMVRLERRVGSPTP